MQLQYGKWYHVGNFYQRYHRGGSASYLDVKGPASCSSNFMDVSTAAQKDRIGRGTGLWRLVHATLSPGAAAKKPGDAVKTGDTFYLQNCFGSGSYLDVCGPCRACANNNKMDVSTSFVRHREGDGSKTSIWQIVRAVFPDQPPVLYDTVFEDDLVNIQSMCDNSFLDVCGPAQSPGNLRDVSTASVPNRDSYSGAWHFTKYDSAGFEAIVRQEEDVPPHTVKIERIQCVVPSSGVWGSEYIGIASGIIVGAMATATFAVGAGMAVATSGGATPLAVGLVALVGAESAAISGAITVGIQKVSWKIGQLLPDQAYITVNGNKVWPTNSDATNMNAGDCLDVKWMGRRPEPTVIEIWEHDSILSDDQLFEYQLPPDAQFVNNPIVAINEDKGSSYMIYLTATKDKSTRQLLIDARKEALAGQMT